MRRRTALRAIKGRQAQRHLGTLCADCHQESDWKKTLFDHGKTKFPLTGKHRDVVCKDCHADPKFKGAPTACIACHKKDDEHKGKFGAKCESCHADREWKTIIFNHDKDTKYLLRGKHRLAECTGCHTGFLSKEKLRTACVACHKTDDDKKGHKGRFGEKCESCHTERTGPSRPLTITATQNTRCVASTSRPNARAAIPASYIRRNSKPPVACHRADDDKKGHKGRFGDKCESCHVEKDWKAATFNHDRDTKYVLRGKHIAGQV